MRAELLTFPSSFELVRTIQPIYLGGHAQTTPDERYLVSSLGEDIHILDLETGLSHMTLKGEAGDITCFAIKPNGKHLVATTRSLLIKCFDLETGNVVKAWKGHEAPVLTMAFDSTSTLVATGSADSTVKVWDVDHGHATHNFRGHAGVVSAVAFANADRNKKKGKKRMLLASGSEDCKINIWDLLTKTLVATLESHVSVIRGLQFFADGERLVSGGRDKVMNVWNMEDLVGEMTIPTYESVESLFVVDRSLFGKSSSIYKCKGPLVCTGGENGMRQLSFCEFSQLLKEKKQALAVTTDQNFLFYDLENEFKECHQVVGYNEEVIDIAFVTPTESQVAVATNSEQIRIYSLDNCDSQILYGHEGTAVCLDRSRDGLLLISGSKDKTAIVWRYSEDTEKFFKFGVCTGHAESVGAVAFARKSSSFALTGSEDRTVKFWEIPRLDVIAAEDIESFEEIKLKTKFTFQAHEKDINSIAVAPNDRLFATGSQDKTAKIWSCADGSLLGDFRGHRRGVWCVNFSPVDQVLATSSADKTIKLWSLADFSCLKTFEGHLNSVLKVSFLSLGMQLLSTGSDGLMKLWTIRSMECVKTLDNHEDKVWALATKGDESLVATGAGDAKITFWRDCTSEDEEKRNKESEDRVIKEQDLANCIVRKDFKNAFLLAIELDQPFRLLGLLKDLRRSPQHLDSETGSKVVDNIIKSFDMEQTEKLLLYVRDWNTNTKHSSVAQTVLNLILRSHPPAELLKLPRIKEVLDGLIAYTTRHLGIAEEMLKKSHILDYTLDRMTDLLGASDMDIDEP
ncbi:Transducin (beta)-like 3 [Dinochytrium kinnereticum]|nr:Transducin (beta)-like 3 [Dinochytrium kinnereticum]